MGPLCSWGPRATALCAHALRRHWWEVIHCMYVDVPIVCVVFTWMTLLTSEYKRGTIWVFCKKGYFFNTFKIKTRTVSDLTEWYPLLAILWCSNFGILDSNSIPSCTSAGSVLHLCKVSQNSNKPFRRSCVYKVHDPPYSWKYKLNRRTDGQGDYYIPPPQTLFAGGIKKNKKTK